MMLEPNLGLFATGSDDPAATPPKFLASGLPTVPGGAAGVSTAFGAAALLFATAAHACKAAAALAFAFAAHHSLAFLSSSSFHFFNLNSHSRAAAASCASRLISSHRFLPFTRSAICWSFRLISWRFFTSV